MNEYEKQAQNFCNKYGVYIHSKYLGHGKYFQDDKENRSIWEVTIKREGRRPYTFKFGQSINDSYRKWHNGETVKSFKEPTAYDILACLEKGGGSTFEDFCADFGYDSDSRKAYAIWEKWVEEALRVEEMFSDCMDELREIN